MQFDDPTEYAGKDPGGNSSSETDSFARAPELAVAWSGGLEQLISSFREVVRGPKPLKAFSGDVFFHDSSVEHKLPLLAFTAGAVCHLVLILFPFPLWSTAPRVQPIAASDVTWYGPLRYLPPLAPKKVARNRARETAPEKLQAKTDSESPRIRQTIITEPLHPNHPRQMLLQSKTSLEAPKIVAELPNIIQLPAAQPAQPRLQLSVQQLAAVRPSKPNRREAKDIQAPDVTAQNSEVGAINILASAKSPLKPALPVNALTVPHSARKTENTNSSSGEVPTVAAGSAANMLIALSATPAPVAPPSIPAAELSARISASPTGTKYGANGAGSGDKAGLPGGGNGPEGIFVGGEEKPNGSPRTIVALPTKPSPQISARALDGRASSKNGSAILLPGASHEAALGAKRVYTLEVNMPNMTSASGSWVLNFAELNEERSLGYVNPATLGVAAPVPLRKVDPKYPPLLQAGRVEGEVVLYAVIRKDGTVDSIHLVRGVDPDLDANAIEALAQWKFQPAEKHGAPADLEAVVHIPFRLKATIN